MTIKNLSLGRVYGVLACAIFAAACDGQPGAAPPSNSSDVRDASSPSRPVAPDGGEEATQTSAHNMRLVGHHDLQSRSAYMPVIHAYGNRRILFVGHHAGRTLNPLTGEQERNGLSLLDVTDPAAPVLLSHLPPSGDEANGTQHVQICNGSELPNADASKVYAVRTNGNLSYELLDVTDPEQPRHLTTIAETGVSSRPESARGVRETHKSQWNCATGVAYMNGTAAGWRVTRLLQAFDLSNPEAPRHIRDFGLDGWQPEASGPFPAPDVSGLHQPFAVADRLYLGYGSGGNGVLQIVDLDKFLNGNPATDAPFTPTTENLLYPQIGRLDFPSYWGVHTAKPIYDFEIADYADNRDQRVRNFLITVSESGTFRCQENRDVMFIIDVTEEDKPLPVSTFQVPEEPGDFCHRGGRFGPHSMHDAYHPNFDKRLVLLSYFNAGVRAVDIRNPFQPMEVGHFIPEITENTSASCIEIDGREECDRAIQTNNVNIDDRGYVYAVDRASTGVHIIELTGAAAEIVD